MSGIGLASGGMIYCSEPGIHEHPLLARYLSLKRGKRQTAFAALLTFKLQSLDGGFGPKQPFELSPPTSALQRLPPVVAAP